MLGSPLHSQQSIGSALIGGIAGIVVVGFGVKTILKREITAGPKRVPYQTIRGRYAIQIGVGIIIFGLYFIVPAVLGLFELYQQH